MTPSKHTRFMKAKYLFPVLSLMLPTLLLAQAPVKPTSNSYMSNGVFLVMVAIIFMLMLVIVGMAELVKAGATNQRRRQKEKEKKSQGNDDTNPSGSASGDVNSAGGASVKMSALLVLFLFIGSMLVAQDSTAVAAAGGAGNVAGAVPAAPFNYWGLGPIMFLSLTGIIVFESIIIYMLYRMGIGLLRNEEDEKYKVTVAESFMESKLVKAITGNQTAEEEEALLMDHEYDGIRELDNNLPAWWKYGFYLTIVVAVVYLFNYHVLHLSPLSVEEYRNDSIQAEKDIAEYKKNNVNAVDESNVVRLIDENSVAAGKGIFMSNCTPCHGTMAEGKEGLGPNLTDDYWKHKGGITNVFKSIKYGWTDKGMKSWQQDLKPLEIQQVASYVLSLRGSNPPNAKEKEGDLYLEEGQQADTTAAAVKDTAATAPDSIQVK